MRRKLLPGGRFWMILALVLAASIVLANLDPSPNRLHSLLVYLLMLGISAASLYLLGRQIDANRAIDLLAIGALVIRLGIGIGLNLLLPEVGYADNLEHRAGYVFTDAYQRDHQAWELATSSKPLSQAFRGVYSGDQYGGMLWLSALVYRILSPDAHRPYLILILTATAAAWGTLTLWKASQAWFDTPIPILAATVFAFYPESVLLGSSQMRESFIISAVAMSLLGLVELLRHHSSGLAWLTAAGAILLVFHPPSAMIVFITLLGLWVLDSQRWRNWKLFFVIGGLTILAALMVITVWANLPSLNNAGSVNIVFSWLQNNFKFQTYLMERGSGMMQKLLDTVGEQWAWLVVVVYGTAQPVLPAVVGDPDAAWIMRILGFFRAFGWYALAPFLLYGTFAALLARQELRRAQLSWIAILVWAWVIIAAFNAGGDQWDNPRYRTIMLAWQALLAAWAWTWAQRNRDPWLRRWLWVEGIFILLFTEWYLGRYYPHFVHLDIFLMIGIALLFSVIILVGGWLRDRRKRV